MLEKVVGAHFHMGYNIKENNDDSTFLAYHTETNIFMQYVDHAMLVKSDE